MHGAAIVGQYLSRWLGLGLPPGALAIHHIMLRGAVVYVAGVMMVRLAPRRFMGRHTPFDLILGIILGAVLARSINGGAPLVPTLAGGFALVFLDRAFAAWAYHSGSFRKLVEGEHLVLVRDGSVNRRALHRSYLSEEDLRAAVRTRGGIEEPDEAAAVRIERSGEISVVSGGP